MNRLLEKRLGRQFAGRDATLQNCAERDELASAKEFRKTRLHLLNVAVMAQTGLQGSGDSRLLRIDFPGVQINENRAPVRFDNASSRPPMKPHWKIAKRSSATSGKIPTEHPHRHRRNFAESLGKIDLPAERESWCAGNSVKIMQYRIDAGIVQEAFFGEDRYCPERFTNDRKGRGPIRNRSLSAGTCDCSYRTPRIGTKFVRSETVDPAVKKTVATDLVAGGANLTNDLRVAFCNPAQDEKCPMRVKSREKFEQFARIAYNTAGKIGPGIRRNLAGEGFDVKVVFHVYAQTMQLCFGHMAIIACDASLGNSRQGLL